MSQVIGGKWPLIPIQTQFLQRQHTDPRIGDNDIESSVQLLEVLSRGFRIFDIRQVKLME